MSANNNQRKKTSLCSKLLLCLDTTLSCVGTGFIYKTVLYLIHGYQCHCSSVVSVKVDQLHTNVTISPVQWVFCITRSFFMSCSCCYDNQYGGNMSVTNSVNGLCYHTLILIPGISYKPWKVLSLSRVYSTLYTTESPFIQSQIIIPLVVIRTNGNLTITMNQRHTLTFDTVCPVISQFQN